MTDKERTIVMAYTGIAMLKGDKLDLFYKYIAKLMGRPVFTHELADKEIWKEIKERSKEDFFKLCR